MDVEVSSFLATTIQLHPRTLPLAIDSVVWGECGLGIPRSLSARTENSQLPRSGRRSSAGSAHLPFYVRRRDEVAERYFAISRFPKRETSGLKVASENTGFTDCGSDFGPEILGGWIKNETGLDEKGAETKNVQYLTSSGRVRYNKNQYDRDFRVMKQ
jgi:hypothetical protein